ncbi:galactose-1-phosphate uridylyltransferase [Sulfobacillus harzensis]|uniref:Galactose-1-phosphate uridylyltransferase n=1 Tax=Sulfobacillus harzensis TaxID=2729629 RepID=A0A7Y0Q2Z1_9FIRM|nr:galactose-1-phosphate uridylyltransferase [Sulfobacillus harzensis]NMP22865.1 galactose-1-phosphate uridylyltransferase [Sulfobacillus harzensis]
MAEIRYNPLLDEWVMVAANRQKRPAMEGAQCPFCPGSGQVPEDYQVLSYANDFPVLSIHPTMPESGLEAWRQVRPAYGVCEVVLYSPDHYASLPELPVSQIEKLIDLWVSRVRDLRQDPQIRYIFLFENRGAEVGATMEHPHGQLYAYPFVPTVVQRELDASHRYHQEHGHCLVCDLNDQEGNGPRQVAETEHMVSYIPYFTEYPFGAFVAPRAHKSSLLDLDQVERQELAWMLKAVSSGLDRVYQKPMPYMMALHQAPVNTSFKAHAYHFHVEFYPLLYAPNKIKYRASSEVGAGVAANPASVEETAPLLRRAIQDARRDGQW